MLKRFRVPGRLALKLKEHGVSVAAVLRKAGLPRDLFEQTRVLVSTEELFAIWHAIEAVSADPLIGIKLGVETKTERFHPMAIAALSTQNLLTATEHLARYKKLTAPEEIVNKLSKEEFRGVPLAAGGRCRAAGTHRLLFLLDDLSRAARNWYPADTAPSGVRATTSESACA
jgi:hypothetical protein